MFQFIQCTGNLGNNYKERIEKKCAVLFMKLSVSLLKCAESASKDLGSVI